MLICEPVARDTFLQLCGTEYYFAARVPGYAPPPLGVNALAAADGGWLYAAQSYGDEIQVIEFASGPRTSFCHHLSPPRLTEEARPQPPRS